MTRTAVDEVVLAAVRFVGDDHNVAPLGEQRVAVALLFGEEFLDDGEHHAAGFHRQPGAQGLGDRRLHRMELVVARHHLDQRAAAVVLEHDEIAQQGQKPVGFTDALDHHLQLRHVRVGQRLARNRAPGLEPLPPVSGYRRGRRVRPTRRTRR